ncbi:TolC family protein (plasmid) [Vibrio sp. SS-MA-C1-2]|uniref:TolC family protein n=1 Tax=Vibrio sp. SS-MA-C1-2 TaxID=2908646 RepID=UPI001F1B4EBE|nr:TolC family protein [Vibrio sp. SS-MA-C1-2]UJF20369.1 TolC family protein [Vibrio sp. SS-MA-C1-2]
MNTISLRDIAVSCLLLLSFPTFAAQEINLSQALNIAKEQDLQAQAITNQADEMRSSAIKAGTLPDPSISLGLNNMPTDSFDFNQENMTQLQVGLTQNFAPGSSLKYKKDSIQARAQSIDGQYILRAEQRKLAVEQLWIKLSANKASQKKTKELIQTLKKSHQSVLADYQSGKTNQSTLLTVENNISLTNNQLLSLQSEYKTLLGQLSRWIGQFAFEPLNLSFPDWQLPKAISGDWKSYSEYFKSHPEAKIQAELINSRQFDIQTAKEEYMPKWGIKAGYGYRADSPDGMDRSDFLSVGVTVSVPIHMATNQDQGLNAANSAYKAQEYRYQDTIRSLVGRYQSAYHQAKINQKILMQYQEVLVPNAKKMVSLSVDNYYAATASFNQLILSQQQLLKTELQQIKAKSNYCQSLVQLNYFSAKEYSL